MTGRHFIKSTRNAELMDEDIIGLYLSTEPHRGAHAITRDDEPQLRRFIHDQENIEQPRHRGTRMHCAQQARLYRT